MLALVNHLKTLDSYFESPAIANQLALGLPILCFPWLTGCCYVVVDTIQLLSQIPTVGHTATHCLGLEQVCSALNICCKLKGYSNKTPQQEQNRFKLTEAAAEWELLTLPAGRDGEAGVHPQEEDLMKKPLILSFTYRVVTIYLGK